MLLSRNSVHTNFVLVSQEAVADFFKIAHMPRVIGAVDGSLISIRAPYNDEHMYVCHKGFHGIMAVCNAISILPISHLIGRIIVQKQRC